LADLAASQIRVHPGGEPSDRAVAENLDEYSEMALATQTDLVASAADRKSHMALFLKGLV